jgi:hypothetical protein
MSPRAVLDAVVKRKIPGLAGNRNLIVQPLAFVTQTNRVKN